MTARNWISKPYSCRGWTGAAGSCPCGEVGARSSADGIAVQTTWTREESTATAHKRVGGTLRAHAARALPTPREQGELDTTLTARTPTARQRLTLSASQGRVGVPSFSSTRQFEPESRLRRSAPPQSHINLADG